MLHFMIIGCSAAISSILCFIFWSTSRTEGWRQYRYYAAISLATTLYAICAVPLEAEIFSNGYPWFFNSGSMALSLLTPIFWFSFRREREEREFHYAEKATIAILLVGIAITCVPGTTFGEMRRIGPTWLDQVYSIRETNIFGDLLLSVMMLSFVAIVFGFAKRASDGDRAWFPLLSSSMFLVGGIEEGLVAMDVLDWPFLGSFGFAIGNVLMAVELAAQLVLNSNRVEKLNLELKASVLDSTNELMSTQMALMAAQRHHAVGSLAAGVSHEINNPLAYVSGNLQFVREAIEEFPDWQEEVRAIDDAILGVERIGEVIASQKLYVQRSHTGMADVRRAIDTAVRVVKPQTKFTSILDVRTEQLSSAQIDESRLVQVIVNLLLNASLAKRHDEEILTTQLIAFTTGGSTCIEISDRDEVALNALQSEKARHFARDTTMSRGDIAIFVCRGIVEACGGTVTALTQPGKDSFVRVLLPAHNEGEKATL